MNSEKDIDAGMQAKLQAQTEELDRLMRKENNLMTLIQGSFKAGLGTLMSVGYMLAILLAIVIFYSGYQYFGVEASDKSFWGMILLISFQAQVATKMWIWQEMNRASTIKEIKRLQLLIVNA